MNTITSGRIGSSSGAGLAVRRSGIRFQNVAPGQVRIEIEVENRSAAHSEPALLRLQAAPFGAFVRWAPLATLVVPGIPAQGRALVRTVARQPRPRPIGSFRDLVPPGLLAAAGAGEERRPVGLQRTLPGLLLRSSGDPASSPGGLPPDILELLDCPRVHWAGNLKVWFAGKPVERHFAPGMRVYPGWTTVAPFCLGGAPDRYAFRIEDPGWRHALYDPAEGRTIDWTEDPAQEPRWYLVCGVGPARHGLRRSSARVLRARHRVRPRDPAFLGKNGGGRVRSRSHGPGGPRPADPHLRGSPDGTAFPAGDRPVGKNVLAWCRSSLGLARSTDHIIEVPCPHPTRPASVA